MSKKLYTESYVQNIADAIREKNGLTDTYMLGEMATAIRAIQTGADLLGLAAGNELFDLDDATIQTEATSIPQYMFYGNANVHNISLNEITNVGTYAFKGCGYIGNINLPKCTEIGVNAFLECRRSSSVYASTINLPKVVTIREQAFREFSINNPNFEFNLPECTTIESGGFRAVIQTYVFGVKKFNLPKIQTIGQYAFQNVVATDFIMGDAVTSIGRQAFESANITNLYCYATTPPDVSNSNLGAATISHIYVPSASVDTYKAAAGWSAYASIIEAIPA